MLAANSTLFPVFDEKKLPFSPRKIPGSSHNLEEFRKAIRLQLGLNTLTKDQFLVFDVLVTHADHRTGYCFPRRERIATEIGVSVATVSRATSQLQKLGIIAKFGRGGFSSSADYVILFSAEAFILTEMLHRGELDRFRLHRRDIPLAINLEEAQGEETSHNGDPGITGSCDASVTRNEQAQSNGFMASVDTQPEDKGPNQRQAKPPRRRTPRLEVLPEHWLEDGKCKRSDLDMRHVAGKFLAYHGKQGVRATANWYTAWIRWVERENTALDHHQGKARAGSKPAVKSPSIPQTGSSASPVKNPSTPQKTSESPVSETPRKRFTPPVPLSSLLKGRGTPSAPASMKVGAHAPETPQQALETPTTVALDPGDTPIGVMSDAERQRRWEAMLASARGKTLRDFSSG